MPAYRAPARKHRIARAAAKVLHRGGRRYCPVCHSHVRAFKPYGHVKRPDAQCPVCGCVERHRFTWRFFQKQTNLFDGRPKRMLHIAPEPAFEELLRGLDYLDYVTVDLQDEHADHCMDVTRMDFEDGCFDVVHCSHVLEHLHDDRKAMREIVRVLAPGGWASILVPMIADHTFEDPSVTDPAERARLFGQWDHVRAYGPDFPDRLREEGFRVAEVSAASLLDDPAEEERVRFKDEQLFFCRPA